MPNETLRKYLNDIVWWIPSRKLRDFIRETFFAFLELKERNNALLFEIKAQNDILLKLLNNNKGYIVVGMGGGFTDQLYLYRLGYSIEKLYNKKVLYDIAWYSRNGKDSFGKYNRNFELLQLFDDIPFKKANDSEIQIARKFFIDALDTADISNIVEDSKILYLNTYNAWCSNIKKLDFNKVFDLDKYFIPKLDKDNRNIYDDIKNSEYSAACHIRRNDYLKVEYRRYNLDENYFIKAIEKIKEQTNGKLKIYFFSDDMDWVKNKVIPLIKDKYDYMAVDINDNDKGYFDFYLISNCKYQIASEGRFCETAHQFNKYKNKILITPKDIDGKYIRK